eukprot:scaffold239540_cov33-Tisochrysis_lutea.AAC.1
MHVYMVRRGASALFGRTRKNALILAYFNLCADIAFPADYLALGAQGARKAGMHAACCLSDKARWRRIKD